MKIISYISTALFIVGFVSLLLAVNAMEFDTVRFATGSVWAVISLGITSLGALGINKTTREEDLKEWIG